MENEEIQTTFNEDNIDELNVDGSVENVSDKNEPTE